MLVLQLKIREQVRIGDREQPLLVTVERVNNTTARLRMATSELSWESAVAYGNRTTIDFAGMTVVVSPVRPRSGRVAYIGFEAPPTVPIVRCELD